MADSVECGICLEFDSEKQNDRFLVTPCCGQLFHDSCICRLFEGQEGQPCPLCRENIANSSALIVFRGMEPRFVIRPVPRLKITLVGDSMVGKTSLLKKFYDRTFDIREVATIGEDCRTKKLIVDGKPVVLHIWDTSGQERFRSITPQFIRNSQGVIIAYDTNHGQSLTNVQEWLNFINNEAPDAVKVVVGTKKDLSDGGKKCSCKNTGCWRSTAAQKEEIARSLDMMAFETSARENINVDIAFKVLATQILHRPDLVQAARRAQQRRNPGTVELAVFPVDKNPIKTPLSSEPQKSKLFNCCG